MRSAKESKVRGLGEPAQRERNAVIPLKSVPGSTHAPRFWVLICATVRVSTHDDAMIASANVARRAAGGRLLATVSFVVQERFPAEA